MKWIAPYKLVIKKMIISITNYYCIKSWLDYKLYFILLAINVFLYSFYKLKLLSQLKSHNVNMGANQTHSFMVFKYLVKFLLRMIADMTAIFVWITYTPNLTSSAKDCHNSKSLGKSPIDYIWHGFSIFTSDVIDIFAYFR